jgi:hypothetical protein
MIGTELYLGITKGKAADFGSRLKEIFARAKMRFWGSA